MCRRLQSHVPQSAVPCAPPQVAVQLLAAPEALGESSLLLRWQRLGAYGHL